MQKGLLLIMLGFIGYKSYAQSIVTDRPDQTEASSTVGKGVLQIETGFSFMTEGYAIPGGLITPTTEGRLQQVALPNTLWRLGVSKRFELRLVTQPELQKTYVDDVETNKVFGVADLQVGFKVNILEKKEGRSEIGFLSHLVVPTGTEGISGGEYGVINKLAVTHSLSENHNLAWNIGYDYLGTGNGDLFYSLSWAISLTEKVGVYLEPYGFVTDLDILVFNADAGFTYLINNNLQFDYSFGLGITEDMNYHAVGLSVRLAK